MPDFTRRVQERGPLALIEIFRDCGQVPTPDDRGEIRNPSPEVAALLRSCGYAARAGETWRCPLLPDEHVRGYWMFEHLSDAPWINWRQWGDGPYDWHPKRAKLLPAPAPKDALSSFEQRVIGSLQEAPDQHLDRGALKRKYWRRSAQIVDHAIDLLIAGDHVSEHDGLLYPLGKAALAERLRPRTPAEIEAEFRARIERKRVKVPPA